MLAAALAVGGCQTRGCLGPQITHAEACADPSLRSDYVRQVLRPATIPSYVTRIDYLDEEAFLRVYPDAGRLRHLPAMVTLPADPTRPRSYVGKQRSRIVVLPNAFDPEQVPNEVVFLLGLLDHELFHAQQAFEGLPDVYLGRDFFASLPEVTAAWLYNTVTELDAHHHELTVARRYRLPVSYYQVGWGAYLKYYVRLVDERHPIPREVRHALLRSRFRPWMLDQPVLRQGLAGWYFELDGAIYPLPAGVVTELGGAPVPGAASLPAEPASLPAGTLP